MLSKKFRLTKSGSFSYVYRKGQIKSDKLITLTYVLSKGAPRVGFSVPNKVGKAVKRNLVKRRMRAIMRAEILKVASAQIVFSAKLGATDLSFAQIKSVMLMLLKSSKLVKND